MKKIFVYLLLVSMYADSQTRRPGTSGVPYSGAVSNVDLNAKVMKNVSNLTVGNASVYTIPVVVSDNGSGYTFDVDPEVVSARTFDPSVNSNGHGFVYASNFSRNTNGFAHNSYRDNSYFSGTSNYNHHSCFESQFAMNSTGTLTDYFGWVDVFHKNAGVTTNRYMGYIYDAAGSGTLTNQYGLYVPALSAATNINAAIRVESNPSYFGGGVQLPSGSGSVGALTPKVEFFHGSPFPGVSTFWIRSELTNANNRLHFTSTGFNFSGSKDLMIMHGDETGSSVDSVIIKSSRVLINAANLNFSSVPTSSVGLSSGQVYKSAGVLMIVP